MNVAPLMTTSLSLLQRCELAISGFVSLDLFSMLAAQKCTRFGLPKGSCFMAQQTQQNLQSCSCAAAVVCITKPKDFEPWRSSVGRMSELAIEEYFGQLRSQSCNAQLSARGYFQAAAKHALQMSKRLNKEKALPGINEPLTDEQQPASIYHFVGISSWGHVLVAFGSYFFMGMRSLTNEQQPTSTRMSSHTFVGKLRGAR